MEQREDILANVALYPIDVSKRRIDESDTGREVKKGTDKDHLNINHHIKGGTS